MFKRFSRVVARWSETRRAVWVLFALSFCESSFFPLPPDLMLAPMALAHPKRAPFFAFICTAGSVLGGLAGYAIGYYAYDLIAEPIVAFYALEEKMTFFKTLYREYGAFVVVIAGVSPIPYKLATIASGASGYDLVSFTFFSFIARGGRFFSLVALTRFSTSKKGLALWEGLKKHPYHVVGGMIFLLALAVSALYLRGVF